MTKNNVQRQQQTSSKTTVKTESYKRNQINVCILTYIFGGNRNESQASLLCIIGFKSFCLFMLLFSLALPHLFDSFGFPFKWHFYLWIYTTFHQQREITLQLSSIKHNVLNKTFVGLLHTDTHSFKYHAHQRAKSMVVDVFVGKIHIYSIEIEMWETAKCECVCCDVEHKVRKRKAHRKSKKNKKHSD